MFSPILLYVVMELQIIDLPSAAQINDNILSWAKLLVSATKSVRLHVDFGTHKHEVISNYTEIKVSCIQAMMNRLQSLSAYGASILCVSLVVLYRT